MTTVRAIALLLVLTPAFTLAVMSGQLLFPILVSFAAIVGALGKVHVPLRAQGEFRLGLGITLLFLLRWLLLPSPRLESVIGFAGIGILDYARAYPIAQALITWQVAVLFVRSGNHLPKSFPVYAALAMIMAGTFPSLGTNAWHGQAYQIASLATAGLTGAFLAMTTPRIRSLGLPPRRFRRSTAAILVVVLAMGWWSGYELYRSGEKLEQKLAEWMLEREPPSAIGFPDDGRIGRISRRQSVDSDGVAMRIISARTPGYLRGKVYDTYFSGNWTDSDLTRSIKPLTGAAPAGLPSQRWFAFVPNAGLPGDDSMLIDRIGELEGAVFTQLESEFVTAHSEVLSVNQHDVPSPNQIVPGVEYRVAGNTRRNATLPAAAREQFLHIPADIDPRIPALAAEITSGCTTDESRKDAIIRYVHRTCTYDLHGTAHSPRDPVATFLFESRKGHCEYFASAVTLLLRCAGVPCRFATGFLADEQNAYGDYWVARNRDAHAWVEVFLEGRGWLTVEATPPDGVPRGGASHREHLIDYVKYAPQRLLAALQSMQMEQLAAWFSTFVSVSTLAGVLLMLGGALAGFVAWRLRGSRAHAPVLQPDPAVAALQVSLAKMDRLMAARGLARGASETLNRFAERVAKSGDMDSASWYLAYAEARYSERAELASQLARA